MSANRFKGELQPSVVFLITAEWSNFKKALQNIKAETDKTATQISSINLQRIDTNARKVGSAFAFISNVADKLAFRLSFIGFIMQFISLMTVMMFSRFTNMAFDAIKAVADWRTNISNIAKAVFSVGAMFGTTTRDIDEWTESLFDAVNVGEKAENIMNIITGAIGALQTSFVKGLLGEQSTVEKGEGSEEVVKEGTGLTGFTETLNENLGPLKDTAEKIGETFQPVFDSLSNLVDFFADPNNQEAITKFVNLIANFIAGVAEGVIPLTNFINALNNLIPNLPELTKELGKLLPILIVIGTILTLKGPVLSGVSLLTTLASLASKGISRLARWLGLATSATSTYSGAIANLAPKKQNIINLTTKLKDVFVSMGNTIKTSVVSTFNTIGTTLTSTQTKLSGFQTFMTTKFVPSIQNAFKANTGKVLGGAALMGLGGAALATLGPEKIMNAFTKGGLSLGEKIQATLGVAGLSFGTALEVMSFVPLAGKFALIGAAATTAASAFVIFMDGIDGITKALEGFLNNPIVQGVTGFFTSMGEGITNALSGVADFFGVKFEEPTKTSLQEVQNTAVDFGDEIKSTIPTDIEFTTGELTTTLEEFSDNTKELFQSVKNDALSFGNELKTAIPTDIEFTTAESTTTLEEFSDNTKELFQSVKNDALSFGNELKTAIPTDIEFTTGESTTTLEEFSDNTKELFKRLSEGLIITINTTFTTIYTSIRQYTTLIISELNRLINKVNDAIEKINELSGTSIPTINPVIPEARSTNNNVNMTFNIIGVTDPEEVAREVEKKIATGTSFKIGFGRVQPI